MQKDAHGVVLPVIPTLDVGTDFPMATLLADEPRAHALMDHALADVPRGALRLLDAVSRRWLVKSGNSQLQEIDAIAGRLARPGTHFLSVNYEWGCTVGVGPSSDGGSARMVRTLDWMTDGLGRYIMAATVRCRLGPFVTLTWPGFTGVLQAMAPGRFCAALNQAPMRKSGGGVYPIDWAINRARVWRMPHQMPAQLLRTVFETARDFTTARRMLTDEKIAAPAIFTLAGLTAEDTCAIERTEHDAYAIDGRAYAGNHWQSPSWTGRARGIDSEGRIARLRAASIPELDPDFPWLAPPVLNTTTRLAMVADAAQGRMVAQGFENCVAVTRPLVWPGDGMAVNTRRSASFRR